MTRREKLEQKCKPLFGSVTDIAKRFDILKDAFWRASNSGYCNAMANRLMAGIRDCETDDWDLACALKHEIAELCEIYRDVLATENL